MTEIDIIESDGMGVGALVSLAGKLHDLTEDRNVTLGVIQDEGLDGGKAVAVVTAKRASFEDDTPHLAVTVERNPRIIRVTPAAAALTNVCDPKRWPRSYGIVVRRGFCP